MYLRLLLNLSLINYSTMLSKSTHVYVFCKNRRLNKSAQLSLLHLSAFVFLFSYNISVKSISPSACWVVMYAAFILRPIGVLLCAWPTANPYHMSLWGWSACQAQSGTPCAYSVQPFLFQISFLSSFRSSIFEKPISSYANTQIITSHK